MPGNESNPAANRLAAPPGRPWLWFAAALAAATFLTLSTQSVEAPVTASGEPYPRSATIWLPLMLLALLPCIFSRVPANRIRRAMRPFHRLRVAAARHPHGTAATLFALTAIVFAFYIARGTTHLALNAWHDAQSNLLQTKIFASGRLAMPSPPDPQDYAAIHVLVHPVYCSKYPIGYPLLMLGPYLCGHAEALLPLIAGATVALTFLGVRLHAGAGAGILASILMATCCYLVDLSGNQNSANVSLCCAAWGLWALARIRRTKTAKLAPLSLGLSAGLLFICRPLDGVLLAALLALPAIAWAAKRSRRTLAALVFWMIAGGMPLACLQLAYNQNVFGHWARFGYHVYDPQYIGHAFGLEYKPPKNPDQSIAVVKAYLEQYVKPDARAQADGNWFTWTASRTKLFYAWLYALGPLLGLVVLAAPQLRAYEWWLLAAPAIVLQVNLLNIFNDERFYALAVPFVVLLIVLAARRAPLLFKPASRSQWRLIASLVLAAALVPQFVSAAQRFARARPVDFYEDFHRAIDSAEGAKKLVILSYERFIDPNDDLGYNDPDIPNAPVIIARDRGRHAVDRLLQRYPDRYVYIYYQDTRRLTPHRQPLE